MTSRSAAFALSATIAASFAAMAAEAATLRFDSGPYTQAFVTLVGSGGTPPVSFATSMRTTGTFQVAEDIVGNMDGASLTLTSVSLFDGISRYSSAVAPPFSVFSVSTNSAGIITGWRFRVTNFNASTNFAGFNRREFVSDFGVRSDSFSVGDDLCSPLPRLVFCSFVDLPSYSQTAAALGTGQQSLAVAAIPLPASGVLLLSGLTGLGWLQMRRRMRQ